MYDIGYRKKDIGKVVFHLPFQLLKANKSRTLAALDNCRYCVGIQNNQAPKISAGDWLVITT